MYFLNIKFLLQIFVTIIVTTATPKKILLFSEKTQNLHEVIMFQERLNVLAILNIHKHILIDVNEKIIRFSRRINVVDINLN